MTHGNATKTALAIIGYICSLEVTQMIPNLGGKKKKKKYPRPSPVLPSFRKSLDVQYPRVFLAPDSGALINPKSHGVPFPFTRI